MCSHQGTVVQDPECAAACEGCEWTATVTPTTQGTNCVFQWTVERRNCVRQKEAEYSGTTTVPCDQQTTLTFYCDPGSTCAGYELKLIGDPCPGQG